MHLIPERPSALRLLQRRRLQVIAGVLLAHTGVIWLFSTSLLNPVAPAGDIEQTIMANVVMEMPAFLAPVTQPVVPKAQPQPRTPAPPQATPVLTPRSVAAPVVTQTAPSTTAPTLPVAAPAPAPAPAQASASAPVSAAAPVATAASAVNQRSATPPTPATAVVLPSSDADYLNNPTPTYPSMSRRMGEQGTVVVRVFISTEGRAEKAEIRTSSGYARLDEAALSTVQRWRYVSGKRAGVAEAMWFNVPIRFLLD